MIYVKNFAIEEVEEAEEKDSEDCNVNLKEFTTQTSRSPKCKPLEVYDVNPNNTENNNTNINNILFGLATNLLGIIVTVSFVQYFIDKQDARQREREEKAQILRYNRLMSVLVQRYKMYFYCVVTPMEMRAQKDINALDENFNFENMRDLHEQSLYICDGCAESSIALLYKAENKVREYMVRMLESVQFKYNEELKM